jgi:hypothetical protein
MITTTIEDVTKIALGKHYTKEIKDINIAPGLRTINEEISLRIVGTIERKPDTEVKPPLKMPIAHVLAVLIGNIETYHPEIADDVRENMQRTLRECATKPERIEKNYPSELVVTKDMVDDAEAYYKKRVDLKPRKGAMSFHGEVTVIS